jgi:hypothetical protein
LLGQNSKYKRTIKKGERKKKQKAAKAKRKMINNR